MLGGDRSRAWRNEVCDTTKIAEHPSCVLCTLPLLVLHRAWVRRRDMLPQAMAVAEMLMPPVRRACLDYMCTQLSGAMQGEEVS